MYKRQFKGTERFGVVARQMIRVATTEPTYAWLRDNDDAVIAMIPETFRSNAFPGLGRAFCSDSRAEDWQQFVTAHADDLPGYERDLAQTVESIQLCAALKKAHGADLVAAFANYQ